MYYTQSIFVYDVIGLINNGIKYTVERAKAIGPYADLIRRETSNPDLGEAKEFADEFKKEFPDRLLAYNCSPSFNRSKFFDEKGLQKFREDLASLGYVYQFITLAGWHCTNNSMFELSKDYKKDGMLGYANLQNQEELNTDKGYRAHKHQAFVGNEYYDNISNILLGGDSFSALKSSTEIEQF